MSISTVDISDTGFKGKLLVSHPNLKDRNFDKSVVFIYDDNPTTGSHGFIVNKPSLTTVDKLLRSFNFDSCLYSDKYVGYGGPINEGNLVILHTPEWYSKSTLPINPELSISGDRLMFDKIASENAPRDWVVLAGAAGWRAGQLAEEVNREMWLVADFDQSIIFGNHNNRWHKTIELAGKRILDKFF